MSLARAASTSIVPSTARHSRPSIVSYPNRDHVLQLRPLGATARLLDLGLELGPELLHHRADGHRHRVAEHAQAVADDLRLHGGHDVEVHRGGLAGLDSLDHP
jgi:hypothetical protein